MTLTATGSIGFDTVSTPDGERDRLLGGSGLHFAAAAALYGPVLLVGVVGEDFSEADLSALREQGIDTGEIERVAGESFFWRGRYASAGADAETLERRPGVYGEGYEPRLSPRAGASRTLFLASDDPRRQLAVRLQCPGATRVALDSRDLWIRGHRDDVAAVLGRVDVAFLNTHEAAALADEDTAALLDMGPSAVVIKRGADGAALRAAGLDCAVPAYPIGRVVDPTGAGDAFAGGFLGFLATAPEPSLETAMLHGAALASISIERFGAEGLLGASRADVAARVSALRVEPLPAPPRGLPESPRR